MLLVFKWCLAKLAKFGMVPDSVAKVLNLQQFEQSSCCKTDENGKTTCTGKSTVKELLSAEEFDKLLKQGGIVIAKFTADWCKPCKVIQPFYEELSGRYAGEADFVTVDVDEFEEISSKYKVAMMPTFLALQKDKVLGTLRGSGEPQLETFVKEHLE
ncbi:MAG: hypothetical protein SGARI_006282 [Bacillariaceae sp.]